MGAPGEKTVMQLSIKAPPYWLKRIELLKEAYRRRSRTDTQKAMGEEWVIYTRFSIEEQAEGYSEEQQIRECQAFADSRGWRITDIYSDRGRTGTNADRPAFQRLLRNSKKGKFDGVLTHKIDRTFRNAQGMLSTFNDWTKQGISFASATEVIDFSTPWGKFILAVLAMLAEIFIDNLREETKKGKRGRFHKGLHNGPIPFGYCNGQCSHCTDTNGPGYCYRVDLPDLHQAKHTVPHPVDSLAVKHAYHLYQLGTYTDRQIADALNHFQVKVPDGHQVQVRSRGKPGQGPGPFTKEMVRDMLQNIFYIGKVPYYGSEYDGEKVIKHTRLQDHLEGLHPPLITEAEFNRALQIRDLKGKAPQGQGGIRRQTRVYVLQGLLDCYRCGVPMHCQAGGSNVRRHVCWTRIQRKDGCDQISVKADLLEAELADQMARLKLPEVWQEEIIGYLLDEEGLAVILTQRQVLQQHFDYIYPGIVSAAGNHPSGLPPRVAGL